MNDIADRIYEQYEVPERLRSHLGASQIGRPCDREIWYAFRWVGGENFSGRMKRLFNRGKREEPEVLAELRAIGYEVAEEKDGKQINFSDLGRHFCGSVDGVGKNLQGYFVIEIKTANDSSWKQLNKQGVKESKPEHYCQMQTYMGELKMKRALYLSVNKNDDQIYVEWVHLIKEDFTALRQRAKEIIFDTSVPDKLSENPAHYVCKMCRYRDICHKEELALMTCRTCKYAEPVDGGWKCNKHDKMLSYQDQRDACNDFEALEDIKVVPF